MSDRKKVMIIDDEKDLLEELSIRMESCQWDVIIASNGLEGLEMVKKGKPDLIVLDVVMPKMNGYQVCRSLKADPATQHIPIILLTAMAQANDKAYGKEMGASDYLSKPCDVRVLIEKMKVLLIQPSIS